MTNEYDRVATIPVRHRGSDYLVQVGLDAGREEFHLISVTNPTKPGKVEKEFDIYLCVLKEPGLRANLPEAIGVENKAQIEELRRRRSSSAAGTTGSGSASLRSQSLASRCTSSGGWLLDTSIASGPTSKGKR